MQKAHMRMQCMAPNVRASLRQQCLLTFPLIVLVASGPAATHHQRAAICCKTTCIAQSHAASYVVQGSREPEIVAEGAGLLGELQFEGR